MEEPTNLVSPEQRHIPVLLDEVVRGLAVRSGGRYVDATVGGGGHALAILERAAPDGQLLGLDRDPEAAARARVRLAGFEERAQILNVSYRQLKQRAEAAGCLLVDGVLFDLGFSSWQIDNAERGFSFRLEGPLDMRFNPEGDDPTAADLVNYWDEKALADLFWRYGEERRSRRIAQAIVAARPVHSTQHLAQIIEAAVGHRRHSPIHPATRTFQALRIAVNRELETLQAALPQAIEILCPGGRLAVIAFHSLEDRVVKQFFKQEARGCICPPSSPICTCGRQPTLRIITRKPIVPSQREIHHNPRSRSAKLRVAEKL